MHLAIEWSIKLTAKNEFAGLLGLAGFEGLAGLVCQWSTGLIGFDSATLIGLAGHVGLAEFVRFVGHDGFV